MWIATQKSMLYLLISDGEFLYKKLLFQKTFVTWIRFTSQTSSTASMSIKDASLPVGLGKRYPGKSFLNQSWFLKIEIGDKLFFYKSCMLLTWCLPWLPSSLDQLVACEQASWLLTCWDTREYQKHQLQKKLFLMLVKQWCFNFNLPLIFRNKVGTCSSSKGSWNETMF